MGATDHLLSRHEVSTESDAYDEAYAAVKGRLSRKHPGKYETHFWTPE